MTQKRADFCLPSVTACECVLCHDADVVAVQMADIKERTRAAQSDTQTTLTDMVRRLPVSLWTPHGANVSLLNSSWPHCMHTGGGEVSAGGHAVYDLQVRTGCASLWNTSRTWHTYQ